MQAGRHGEGYERSRQVFGAGLGFHNSGTSDRCAGVPIVASSEGRQYHNVIRGTHVMRNVAPMRGTHGYRDSDSMNTLPDKKSLIHSLPALSVLPLVIEKRASPNCPLR